MIRVDVKGSSNSVLQAKKRGSKGPRKQLEQLDTALESNAQSMMALQDVPKKRRANQGGSVRSNGSRDETATPPPTLPTAAQRLASEP